MKVTVRAALCVSPDGSWNVVGWGGPVFRGACSDRDKMAAAIGGLEVDNWREFWLEVEVDAPALDPVTVQGTVKDAAP